MVVAEAGPQFGAYQGLAEVVSKLTSHLPLFRKPYQKPLVINLNGIARKRLELTSVGAKVRELVITEQQLTQNSNPSSLFSMNSEMVRQCEEAKEKLCKDLRIPRNLNEKAETIMRLRKQLDRVGLLFTKTSSPKVDFS